MPFGAFSAEQEARHHAPADRGRHKTAAPAYRLTLIAWAAVHGIELIGKKGCRIRFHLPDPLDQGLRLGGIERGKPADESVAFETGGPPRQTSILSPHLNE